MTRFSRLLVVLCTTAVYIFFMAQTVQPVAASNTISVAAGIVAINKEDGLCSLLEAIANANTDTAVHRNCPAGSGTDTLVLAASTYSLTAGQDTNYGPSGLVISSHIVISGHGATLVRDTSTALRLAYVQSNGQLDLFDVALQNGYALGGVGGGSGAGSGGGGAGLGGAIYNRGELTLNRVLLKQNRAEGGSVGFSFLSTGGGGGGGISGGGGYSIATFGGSSGEGGGGGGTFATGLDGNTFGGAGGAEHGGMGGTNTSNGQDATGVGGGGGGGGSTGCGGDGGFGGGGGGNGLNVTACQAGDGGFGGGGGGGADEPFLGGHGGFGGADGMTSGGGGAGFGGAIFNDATGKVHVINSTFTGNTAVGGASNDYGWGGGAAIFNRDGKVEIRFSTFYENLSSANPFSSTQTHEASLFVHNDSALSQTPTITIEGSIVDNPNSNHAACHFDGVVNSVISDNNMTFAGDCAVAGNLTADPLLQPLMDNGGVLPTHALPWFSPARNALASCNAINQDQRQQPRPFDGRCDLGAYETRMAQVCGATTGGTLAFSELDIEVEIIAAGDLACVNIEHMPTSHPTATAGIETGNYWRIQAKDTLSNPATFFNVSLTLPYATPTAASRACRWPGGLGGFGWDCDDGSETSHTSTSVMRQNITAFSDWAIGQDVGPTAVQLQRIETSASTPVGLILGLMSLLAAATWVVYHRR